MKRLLAAAALLFVWLPPARADEGMWTLDNFPSGAVKQKYGVDVDAAWLAHAQRSSARLAGGCSGSFVSPEGLVLTNHHCALACIQAVSSAKNDFLEGGFYAATKKDEVVCPGMEVDQLVETRDVTGRLQKATAGLAGAPYLAAQQAEQRRIESECTRGKAETRCDVVSLYHGGRHHLYRYRRFQDVRLAFAPEKSIATFGGDPDNFNFPRYDLDMALLRVWDKGKPAKTPEHFRWSAAATNSGDPLFVTGHPWRTNRFLTIAQLKLQRDVELPRKLLYYAELRGRLLEFSNRSPESRRVAAHEVYAVENAIKVWRGQFEALLDDRFFERKTAEETAQRARIAADPAKQKVYGAAWDDVEAAVRGYRDLFDEHQYVEKGAGFDSSLFRWARRLVRGAEERPKPNEKRLREYSDASLPQLELSLLAAEPVDLPFEEAKLAFSISKMREALGVDHPVVRKVLGKESPERLAASLMKGTALSDPAVRKALWESGAPAVKSSKDPMIQLAIAVDADARALRKRYEDEVEAPLKRSTELIAKADFETKGTSTYPDATGTLRVSYGQVKGWVENGRPIEPFTRIGGTFERATGQEPFRLPASWLAAQARLDPATRFNFVTTHDVIGGNSGSPVLDAKGELVGMVFDGNLHSLAGDYWYDEQKNRTVHVHRDAILETMRVVYGAERLLEEMKAPAPKKTAAGD